MLNRDDLVERLLEALPSARSTWENGRRDYGAEGRLYYIEMSAFAQQLVADFAVGRTGPFPALFDVVEHALCEGDEETRGLVVAGLLEDLQNGASHRAPGYTVFEPWLGPQSLRAWRELEAHWEGKGSLADVIRSER